MHEFQIVYSRTEWNLLSTLYLNGETFCELMVVKRISNQTNKIGYKAVSLYLAQVT